MRDTDNKSTQPSGISERSMTWQESTQRSHGLQ